MKSNYKAIADLVERIYDRNDDGTLDLLVGLSIEKCFIRSVANTIGTDLTKYKIIRKDDFAVSLMQVSRDSKIPVARFTEEAAIITPAYSVFRVKDKEVILPEYLDMWFKRNEFDREAAFIAVGGVRGSMPWDEFARMRMLVPEISEQKEIVESYKVITNRIELKQKINDNLLFCAQTYFKKTYVDFEGVPSNELIKTPDGLIPNGWTFDCVGNYCRDNIANLSKSDKYTTIKYLDTGGIFEGFVESTQQLNLSTDEIPSRAKRKVFDGDIVYSTVRPNLHHFGLIKNPNENFIASTGFAVLHNNGGAVSNELIYMWLTKDSVLDYLQAIAENSVSTYPSLNVSDLLNVKIIIPTSEVLDESNRILATLFDGINANNLQIALLNQMKQTLLPILFSDR